MKFKRTRYQFGGLERKTRKHGPDVWAYRYRELQPDGTVKHKSKMLGTVEQYPSEAQAWKAAEVLRLSANPDNPAQNGVSWEALIDRYIATELPPRKDTADGYRNLLLNRIRPKWGQRALTDVKPFAVEEWLKSIRYLDGSKPLAPKSKKHIRNLMQLLYGCAMRWEFVPNTENNPFGGRMIRVENATKRKKRRSLEIEEFHALLKHKLIKIEPIRTMVTLAVCLGLRRSELFALRWSDIDWQKRTLRVVRRIVAGVLDEPKSERSKDPLPLADELIAVLSHWKMRARYTAPERYVFSSSFKRGTMPLAPDHIQDSRLRPAGKELHFADSLGWHTFRHTYRTFLDQTGAPISVQQYLMRHADSRQTLEYGEAVTQSNREAHGKVVSMVFGKQKQVLGDRV